MADELQSPRVLARLRRAARLVFAPLAVTFLLYFAWRSRALLFEMIAGADLRYLVLAVLAWSMVTIIAPALSMTVFRGCGNALAYSDAARIHISNLPARYLPGGIWHTVGRVVGYRQAGIANGDIAVFVLLENALGAATAFALGGGVLALLYDWQGWGMIAAISAAAGLILIFILPLVPRWRLSRSSGAPGLCAYVTSVLIVALSWCVAASAFVAFVRAFDQMTASVLEIAGTYLFSWAVGFVTLIAPQGIGVFEVVAAELLRDSAPLTGIAALLAMFRLVILLSDAVVYLGAQLAFGRLRQSR